MQLTTGTVLQATALLDGSFFEDALVLIAAYNDQGATGFMFNKLFPRTLNQLEEFKHSQLFDLYTGGPVETEGLFFIHCRPDLIEAGTPIYNGMYMGGNFGQAIECINKGILDAKHIKLFIGYCGWDAGELEAELEEGSWSILANNHSVF